MLSDILSKLAESSLVLITDRGGRGAGGEDSQNMK
jgi:hypothetical protein